MTRSLPEEQQEFDVLVVGGGIFGISVAWDAAQRGLSVALIEKGDFAGATSANSFRMIHGGFRYLQHADVFRIRESCHERQTLLRIAPHLALPLPIVIPTYGRGLERKSVLRAAFLAYELATIDRNLGIRDPARRIPAGRIISRAECLRIFPGLKSEGLDGAGVFCDGQMYNPTRLALAFLRSAVEAGAQAANHLQATRFLKSGNRIRGVVARDLLNDEELEVRARVVVNAAGPWAHRILEELLDLELEPRPVFSRDAAFVVHRRLLGDHALAVQGRTKDPDAVISRGHRHLFVVPWRDYTIIGVWHVVYPGSPDGVQVAEEELAAFIDEVNEAYPGLGISLDDVSLWNAGLVLFGENRPGAEDLSYGKRSIVVDHAAAHGVEGLVTVIGVRWTTARGIAEKVVDLAFRKLGTKPPRCRTAVTPLHGGDIENFEDLARDADRSRPAYVDSPTLRRLLHNYGSKYSEVLRLADASPQLQQNLDDSRVLQAEVVLATREEMARKLGDVALRRTDLATGCRPSSAAIRQCADLMAAELGWSEQRKQCEIEEFDARYPR